MIRYSRDASDSPMGRDVLDSPLQCAIAHKAGNDSEARPYSAGLAGVDASVPVEARAAAAFFSTIATAMIDPS